MILEHEKTKVLMEKDEKYAQKLPEESEEEKKLKQVVLNLVRQKIKAGKVVGKK